MNTFFLHAEIESDREALASVLAQHFKLGHFQHFSVIYNEEKDFTRINISANVTLEMMKAFISEVEDGHRMLQTLATDINEDDYNWRDFYFASS